MRKPTTNILIRCARCKSKSDLGASTKRCPKCGADLKQSANRRFRAVYTLKEKTKTGLPKRPSQLCDTKMECRKFFSDMEEMERRGQDVTADRMTMDMLWEKYLAEIKLPKEMGGKLTWDDDETRWERHAQDFLGHMLLDDIKPQHIDDVLRAMMNKTHRQDKKYAPATIRHVRQLCHRLFNWGRRKQLFYGLNPVDGAIGIAVKNKRFIQVKPIDALTLLKTAAEYHDQICGTLVQLGMLTGRRKGQLARLTWRQADMESKRFNFEPSDNKQSKSIQLPMPDPVYDLLLPLYKEGVSPDDFVFGKDEYTRIDYHWYKIREAAGFDKSFRFHDLRHAYAGIYLSEEVSRLPPGEQPDFFRLKELLGHKSIQSTLVYSVLLDDATKVAANVVSTSIANSEKQEAAEA